MRFLLYIELAFNTVKAGDKLYHKTITWSSVIFISSVIRKGHLVEDDTLN